MEDLAGNLVTLGLLILLQAVLGFDNLLYISLESKRVPLEKQNYVRKVGISLAIILRIVLLFVLVSVIEYFKDPFYVIPDNDYFYGSISIHSLIVLLGGAFIVYTATKEVLHMMSLEQDKNIANEKASMNSVIFMIIIMNLVFSFDSILSAIALTDVFWVMAVAIIVSGILMIWLAEKVSNFLKRNRMYEVLGLFVLFVVGIMLLTEGGHLAHIHIFGEEIVAMSKTTFYFVIGVLIITDLVQSRYQRKLNMEKNRQA